MEKFKKTVAENIIKLRTHSRLTQSQLGEALSYSDKSISKWERAEALPDAFVLKKMSELFGVSVDYLLTEHNDDEIEEAPKKQHRYSRTVITLIALFGVWAAVIFVFVVLWLIGSIEWLIFVYAVPVSLILLLVLNSVWGKAFNNIYIISGIVWGILSSVYMTFIDNNWWQLFLVGIPAQIIIILCFYIKNNRNT